MERKIKKYVLFFALVFWCLLFDLRLLLFRRGSRMKKEGGGIRGNLLKQLSQLLTCFLGIKESPAEASIASVHSSAFPRMVHLRFVFIFIGLTLVAGNLDFPNLVFDDSRPQPLSEYGAVMPPDAYHKLLEIYNRRHMIALDKFKELDDLFMTLPKDVLAKMPLPKIFRQLPEDIQRKLHDTYYNKSLPFEAKLEALDEIITTLPEDLLKLLPQAPEFPEVPEAVEFQVTVLLQFNGYFVSRFYPEKETMIVEPQF